MAGAHVSYPPGALPSSLCPPGPGPRQAFLLEGTPRILSASSLRPLSQMPPVRKLYYLPVNQKAMAVNRKVQSSKPV
jgi:hypothetical protein